MRMTRVLSISLIFLAACSRPNYSSETQQAFMKSCLSRCVGEATRAMGKQATPENVEKAQSLCGEMCECSYAEITRALPYADFAYMEKAEGSGKPDERSQKIKGELEKLANGCLQKMGILK